MVSVMTSVSQGQSVRLMSGQSSQTDTDESLTVPTTIRPQARINAENALLGTDTDTESVHTAMQAQAAFSKN